MKANAELFPFGLFGNVQEAGGRATDLNGTPIAEKIMVNQLYLNLGLPMPCALACSKVKSPLEWRVC